MFFHHINTQKCQEFFEEFIPFDVQYGDDEDLSNLSNETRSLVAVISQNEQIHAKKSKIKRKPKSGGGQFDWRSLIEAYSNRPIYLKYVNLYRQHSQKYICIQHNMNHSEYIQSFYSLCNSYINFEDIDERIQHLMRNYTYLLIRCWFYSLVPNEWIGGRGLIKKVYAICINGNAPKRGENGYKTYKTWSDKMGILLQITSLFIDIPDTIHLTAAINVRNGAKNSKKWPTFLNLRKLLAQMCALDDAAKQDLNAYTALIDALDRMCPILQSQITSQLTE